ncbi:MAG: hypothetical protein ABI607_00650 [Betaproteobacteria bacterium]
MSRALLAALLFAQGAIAAYACPALAGTMTPTLKPVSTVPMPPDCEHVVSMAAADTDTPNLCQAHCQLGQQSNDHPAAPTVPPVVASILVIVLPDPALMVSAGRPFTIENFTAAASVPHTILHCCFRI